MRLRIRLARDHGTVRGLKRAMRLLLTSVVLLSSVARADDINGLKSCVTCAGDLDGDGTPDLWIASRDGERGVVWAVSGCDGSLLHAVGAFGSQLAVVGDLDADRVQDLAVVTRRAPTIGLLDPSRACGVAHLYSGRTGALLRTLENAWSVAAAGDVDLDGTPDLWLGCPESASLHSGRTGSLVRRVTVPANIRRSKTEYPPRHFGKSVRAVGDVDGDGTPDVAVGAPGWTDEIRKDGSVFLISASRGTLLAELRGDVWDAGLGWELVITRDLDGDGSDDLLASGIHRAVIAVSTRDFAPIYAVEHRFGWLDAFGSSLDRTGDIDGDGVEDWLVGAYETAPAMFDGGFADVRSGRDGHVIRGLFQSFQHGVDVASAGDVNGDGMDDHVIVIPGMHIARILSGRDGALVREIDLAKLRAQSNDPDVLRTR